MGGSGVKSGQQTSWLTSGGRSGEACWWSTVSTECRMKGSAPLRRMIGSVDSKHAATSSATSRVKATGVAWR